ncbi:MAG: hypothetical protein IIV43_06400, partial [Oscillospiraceae bacterium]|nr:hypothetical protein [Oscillospiraceae bacterium]
LPMLTDKRREQAPALHDAAIFFITPIMRANTVRPCIRSIQRHTVLSKSSQASIPIYFSRKMVYTFIKYGNVCFVQSADVLLNFIFDPCKI